MRWLSKMLSTMNFFLIFFLTAFHAHAQDLEVGAFTPEKAIETLLAEPLDEAVTYTKDANGSVCEYRTKSLRFLVRYCDNPKKGRIGGTIIHTATRQAISYFIQLGIEGDFDFTKEYMAEDFAWRTFSFYYPFVDYDPEVKPNPPVCEAGFFLTQATPTQQQLRRNFSRCDHPAAGTFQEKWRASGDKLRDQPNEKLLIDLTNLHISKFSTPKAK